MSVYDELRLFHDQFKNTLPKPVGLGSAVHARIDMQNRLVIAEIGHNQETKIVLNHEDGKKLLSWLQDLYTDTRSNDAWISNSNSKIPADGSSLLASIRGDLSRS